ncbi:choice-of-anchor J domain-containing protein [Aequorivita sp. KMM 9714]|uniref:T9SS-dependent choice-of-anchor J family protein n=1 Tax=Aequorivita sp. KMM 9714 TaxID=2707173 RepID=UPI0013EBEFD9|nr:choice-of-anchor J domain-containing protein [Aequorivita sp. KMM 9714]NGX84606.1 T9SS type A sorting domain-containing protein [Aequorivita sp. KMM 9714]
MKKITLLAAIVSCFAMTAQSNYFFDDFQDKDISDWTLLDEDGDGYYFIPFDPTVNQNGDEIYLSSQSFDGTPLTPDNYAISPAIDVTGNVSPILGYLVGTQDTSYYNETYTVYVSTGNTVADFMNTDPSVTVSFSENIGEDPWARGTFVPRSLDLSSLAGATTLYIAFRHHDSTDQFIINFDDVSLTDVLAVGSNEFNDFNYFVTNSQLNLSSNFAMENVALYNMLGQQVVSQKLNNTNESVNISELQSGVYIATVSIDGASKSFKIVKN